MDFTQLLIFAISYLTGVIVVQKWRKNKDEPDIFFLSAVGRF